jgi:hypothetical protein
MQDSEKSRYESAAAAFRKAFVGAYVEAKRELEEGTAQPLTDVGPVIAIDVPRSDVLDDQYQGYLPRFAEAGRQAALAARRKGESTLMPPDEGWSTATLRWNVVLN